MSMTKYTIKRIYDPSAKTDGYRVLVDRLWPRGISKERARLDEWNKNVAPSAELRKWFAHKPERFEEFSARYLKELQGNDALKSLKDRLAEQKVVTLLYGARDPKINHASMLRDVLSK